VSIFLKTEEASIKCFAETWMRKQFSAGCLVDPSSAGSSLTGSGMGSVGSAAVSTGHSGAGSSNGGCVGSDGS
jgi:hypothetical protein